MLSSLQRALLMQAGRSAGRVYDHYHPSESSGFGPAMIVIFFAGAIGFPVMIHSSLGNPAPSGFALFIVGLLGSLVCVPVAFFMVLAGFFLGGAFLFSSKGNGPEPDTLTSLNLQPKHQPEEESPVFRLNGVLNIPHR